MVAWARTLLLHDFYSIGCHLSHSHIIALDIPAVALFVSTLNLIFSRCLGIYNTQFSLLLIPPQSSQLSLVQLGPVLFLCFILHILSYLPKLSIFQHLVICFLRVHSFIVIFSPPSLFSLSRCFRTYGLFSCSSCVTKPVPVLVTKYDDDLHRNG